MRRLHVRNHVPWALKRRGAHRADGGDRRPCVLSASVSARALAEALGNLKQRAGSESGWSSAIASTRAVDDLIDRAARGGATSSGQPPFVEADLAYDSAPPCSQAVRRRCRCARHSARGATVCRSTPTGVERLQQLGGRMRLGRRGADLDIVTPQHRHRAFGPRHTVVVFAQRVASALVRAWPSCSASRSRGRHADAGHEDDDVEAAGAQGRRRIGPSLRAVRAASRGRPAPNTARPPRRSDHRRPVRRSCALRAAPRARLKR